MSRGAELDLPLYEKRWKLLQQEGEGEEGEEGGTFRCLDGSELNPHQKITAVFVKGLFRKKKKWERFFLIYLFFFLLPKLNYTARGGNGGG